MPSWAEFQPYIVTGLALGGLYALSGVGLSLGLAPVIVSQLIPVIRAIAASGVGVLLIEQFAAVALSLATGAPVMEGGVLRYSGTAAELKDRPELLRSAYLLRGAAAGAAAVTDGPFAQAPREGDKTE